jgi:putative heme-binding domain-containing protein
MSVGAGVLPGCSSGFDQIMIPIRSAAGVCRGFFFLLLAWVAPVFAADRVPWTTSRVKGSPEPPALARVERVFDRLGFRQPVDVLHDAGRKRWWIAQENGLILSFPDSGNPARADVALDLSLHSKPFTQLLGITLDPDHGRNGFVYAAFTRQPEHAEGSRLSRFRVVQDPDDSAPRLDPESELILLTWLGGGHNGCSLQFGPDGMLYVSTGDGSSPEPPDALQVGQALDNLLSSILRIDVRNASVAQPYRVPGDNPFIRHPGARPEVWAYGFRNPWRMGFAPDGSLWVGDVGWELWETVHRVTSGYNGGWSRVEGPLLLHPNVTAPTPVGRPVAAHGHHEAASLTGGRFYSGSRFPELRDTYLYGDWETGRIWSLAADATRPPVEIADTELRVVSFAPGPDREMYVLDYQGGLHRIARNDAEPRGEFPRRLTGTGLFADTARQVPAAGVVAYEVTAGRWHDGAVATRWIAVPGNGQVTPGPNYGFPRDTVLAKTLSLPGQSSERLSPIETQLLHLSSEGWRAYSYRWNREGTDAELVEATGTTVEVAAVEGAKSEERAMRTWTYSARSDCLRCHNSWSGHVLGFNSPQLASAGPGGLPGLMTSGLVVSNAACQPAFPLASPGDASSSVELRARSWFHVHCAPCHRFGAGASVAARFGADEALDRLNVVGVRPVRGDFNLPDARIIAPGHPEQSTAWYRINTMGSGHMPPIGSRWPDPVGGRVIADWIRSLKPSGEPPAQLPASVQSAVDALRWLDASLPGSPPPAVVRQAVTGTNAAARDLMTAHAPMELRRDMLGDSIDPGRILGLRGDSRRGRELFFLESGPGCARCHRIEPNAILAGPSLAGLATRMGEGAILESLLNPSAQVSPEFQWHEGELSDGTGISGFVTRRDGERIGLRQQDGTIQIHETARVRRLEPIPGSLMPEGLLSGLTAQEAADLMAYLRSLR